MVLRGRKDEKFHELVEHFNRDTSHFFWVWSLSLLSLSLSPNELVPNSDVKKILKTFRVFVVRISFCSFVFPHSFATFAWGIHVLQSHRINRTTTPQCNIYLGIAQIFSLPFGVSTKNSIAIIFDKIRT